jgi:hypothetical protein
VLNAGCFAAGTKLWTPQGYRHVEDLQPGEWVYARAEHDPYGPIAAKLVEAKFERTGRILHLHLPGGRLIRTTPEHPFFLDGKGWTAAGALQAGDRLRTDDGWVTIAEVFDTGTYEPVYNLRVAEYHTYFVGAEGWGWALWAHNAYSQAFKDSLVAALQAAGTFGGGAARGWVQALFDLAAANTHEAWYDFRQRLMRKQLSEATIRDLWWVARGQDPALLAQTQAQVVNLLRPIAQQIAAQLQPLGITVEFGIRGSLATGWSWDKRNNQQGRPWDGNRFDVDAYVKNDQLASGIPPTTSGGTFISLFFIDRAPGFRAGEAGNAAALAVKDLIRQADAALRAAIGSRLEPRDFTFKVFSRSSPVSGLGL